MRLVCSNINSLLQRLCIWSVRAMCISYLLLRWEAWGIRWAPILQIICQHWTNFL
jgi:hypothetical protein